MQIILTEEEYDGLKRSADRAKADAEAVLETRFRDLRTKMYDAAIDSLDRAGISLRGPFMDVRLVEFRDRLTVRLDELFKSIKTPAYDKPSA